MSLPSEDSLASRPPFLVTWTAAPPVNGCFQTCHDPPRSEAKYTNRPSDDQLRHHAVRVLRCQPAWEAAVRGNDIDSSESFVTGIEHNVDRVGRPARRTRHKASQGRDRQCIRAPGAANPNLGGPGPIGNEHDALSIRRHRAMILTR